MPLLPAILLLIAAPSSATARISQGAVLSDPKLDAKVSTELNATSAKAAVQRLAEAGGVSLEVSNQMLSPVLAIRTKDVALRDVMARIAQVTSGEWRKSEDKFILYPDGAKQRREALEERAQRLQEIREGVKSQVEQYNPQPGKAGKGGQSDEDAEVMAQTMSFGGLGSSASVGKAISRILPVIDLSLLAGLEQGERIVFSTAPTFVQRPLPNNLGPVFAELIAEHNKNAAARANEEKEAESAEEKQLREFYESLFGGDKSDKPITERPAKALLVASRESMGFGLNVELRLYGEGGKVVLSGTTVLSLSDGGYMADAMEFARNQVGGQQGDAPKKPVVPGEDKPIQLSQETMDLRRAFSGLNSGGPGSEQKIPDSLLEKFARPDVVEPLALGPGESILAAAKAKGWNLVANLPDDLMSMFDMMQEGPTTANGVLGELMEGSTKAEFNDGWATVWPDNPEKARRERQDRVALARLIAAARSKGAASLDDLAAYAMTSRRPMDEPVAMVYVMLFASNAMQNGMMGMLDWNMLRLYGTLGLTQKQSLASGNALSFGQFIPTQKTHLAKLSFGAEARLEVEGQSKQNKLPGILALASAFLPRQTGDYREEPTEAMPNGLPNGGLVTATITDDIVGKPVGGGVMGQMIAVLGADELAMFEWMKSDPMFAQAGEMMPKLDGLRLGTRKTYTFKFTVAPGVTFTKVLNDDFVDKNAPITKMDNLPAALKAKIAEKVAEFKKNPLPFGLGGKEVIPPK